STVKGNSAGITGSGCGNGIFNIRTLDVTNSTIAGNLPGLFGKTNGGGLCNHWDGGKATLTNVTITGNSSGAGLGGGIVAYPAQGGLVVLQNTIVAGQVAGADCANTGLSSSGHNIDSDGSCSLTAAGDLPHSSIK